MRILNYITGIQGVGPGAVATLDIPVGRRYHSLKAFVSGTFNAAPSFNPVELVASARLLVNGVVIRDLLPADIINIAKFNGITAQASNGELPWYFSEPWRRTPTGEESTSWDLFDQQKCTLEITFNSVSVTGAFAITNLACAVEGAFDYGRNIDTDPKTGKIGPFLAIIKHLRYSVAAPAGQYDLTTLPNVFPIQRVHFRPSTGTLSAIEVYNDSTKVMEGLTAQLSAFYKDNKLDPTAFALSAAFDYTQQISDAMYPKNNNLDFRITSSAINALTAIAELRAPGYI